VLIKSPTGPYSETDESNPQITTSFLADVVHRLFFKSLNLKTLKKSIRFEGQIFLRLQVKKGGKHLLCWIR
jgi:hypothetical protein